MKYENLYNVLVDMNDLISECVELKKENEKLKKENNYLINKSNNLINEKDIYKQIIDRVVYEVSRYPKKQYCEIKMQIPSYMYPKFRELLKYPKEI